MARAGRPTQLLVVTKGRDGATVVTRSARFAVPAVPVVVVDTVGAGDTFTAALLAGLADAGVLSRDVLAARVAGEPGLLRDIVGQALAAAALTCTRPGADPPTAGELRSFLAETGKRGDGPPARSGMTQRPRRWAGISLRRRILGLWCARRRPPGRRLPGPQLPGAGAGRRRRRRAGRRRTRPRW